MSSSFPSSGSTRLRHELSYHNLERATGFEYEVTIASVPSVLYMDVDGQHGNFVPASYRAILRNPEWRRRLSKPYTGSRNVPRSADRRRAELDCANSSDALLMNIFCYPRLLRRSGLCALLGIEPGLSPTFGFRPLTPLKGKGSDRTEIDMSLGPLLIEAKLTESSFQAAPLKRLAAYHDFEEVFDIERLSPVEGRVRSSQLIRGVLAAHSLGKSYVVVVDRRRPDLVEPWFQTIRAVRDESLRSRLCILTWQELAAVLPPILRKVLQSKYGIECC